MTPGSLFAALPGSQVDGARFVPAAIEAGAAAILTGLTSDVASPDIPVLRAEDPRRALARIAARFYGRQPENIVAVTGTSGAVEDSVGATAGRALCDGFLWRCADRSDQRQSIRQRLCPGEMVAGVRE